MERSRLGLRDDDTLSPVRDRSDSSDLPAAVRGFILQPTYRILRGRAVVHLFGVLETGQGFLVRDGRMDPYFYVATDDARRAATLGAEAQEPTDRVTLTKGRPVTRITVPKPPDTPEIRDRLHRNGVRTYEADVLFARRFLIDRGIRGALEIRGEPRPERPRSGDYPELLVFDDPQLDPSDFQPKLSVLSLDIETDMKASQVLSVGLHGCGASEVLIWCPDGLSAPEGAVPCATEADLLRAFAHRVRELDPDVLTGWNVVDFDLDVMIRRAEQLQVRMDLGRLPGPTRIRPGRGRQASEASVPGRVVLDGIQLLFSSFVSMESYSLDAVAREVLGEGKTISGHDRGEEIQRLFREDRERFVEYNLNDARLVTEILDELKLIDLAVERSLLTGLPPHRVGGSIAAFDFLMLSELGSRKIVAPTVGTAPTPEEGTGGGHVLEPQPGLYENVLVYDFRSLYPSLIRTFQIDPLGWVPDDEVTDEDAVIRAPNGAAFSREPGILPRLLDDLFPRRERAKKEENEVASYAIKILMNSFYGVLGTSACRFYNPQIANAITSFGRTLLRWARDRVESLGAQVLYGDTDSLFVASGKEDPDDAWGFGEELLDVLNRDLTEHVQDTWGVESRLDLELERLYLKLLLHHVRGGSAGASKRYAGLVETNGTKRTIFTGLEAVRRDWTDLARQVQRELYDRLFREEPVDGYLAETIRRLRSGDLDDRLFIYRKALRKNLSEYTSTTPPHVAAARKMSGEPGRVVEYVWTTQGPEPAEERTSEMDYEHYVEKQIEPVAEPVLEVLGLQFRKVIGDDKQMDLF